jgi:hypothetical protein
LEFLVGISADVFSPPRKFQKFSARTVGTGLRVRARAEVERNNIVGIVLIEHCATSDFVHFLFWRLVDGGPAVQCRRGRGRTGRDAT